MKKNGLKLAAATAALVGILGAGGVMAYLSDTDSVTNNFHFGKIDIEETEPSWKEPKEVTPNMVIDKDPTVMNVDQTSAFIFQKVSVPVANVVVAKPDGTCLPAADTELFSYRVNDGWTLIGNRDVRDSQGLKVVAREYLYGYGTETAMTEVSGKSKTNALFNNVTVANIIEGQTDNNGKPIELSTQDIKVSAYGIQTKDLGSDNKTAPRDVWAIYANQNSITDQFNK